MNAQKFVKRNKMEHISIEISGNRETMESILERFQEPIKGRIAILRDNIETKKRVMNTQPMSLMTEMQYKREIVESQMIIETLEEL